MEEHRQHMGDLLNGSHGKHGLEISRATSPAGTAMMDQSQTLDVEHRVKRNRPRTFPYFTTLPYPVEDEAQRQKNLSEILKHLYIAIQASDFTPGAVHWTRELRSWLSLKFDPTKEQRVKLVKLYYELALAPGIDSGVAERFASMFMLLTKSVTLCSGYSEATRHFTDIFADESITCDPSKTSPLIGDPSTEKSKSSCFRASRG
jgi:proteasome activator subunit 4